MIWTDEDVPIVSQVTIERVGTHDRLVVWSRGGRAGVLVVMKGDGPKLCARLLGFGDDDEEARDLARDFEENEDGEPRVYEC